MVKYAIMWVSKDGKPLSLFDVAKYLGTADEYGVDMGIEDQADTIEEVTEELTKLLEYIDDSDPVCGTSRHVGSFWSKGYPFDNPMEECEYIKNHVGIFKISITPEAP